MSRPPVFPEKTASGISIDPRTLERVIPESKRADGSVRKQLKIRPGFTPQEDVTRFRGTRQQAMDAAALPKGHILGWVAPSSISQPKGKASAPPPNKNAKRRANQRAKKAAEKAETVKDDWEDDDVDDADSGKAETKSAGSLPDTSKDAQSTEKPKHAAAAEESADLADELSKLEVK